MKGVRLLILKLFLIDGKKDILIRHAAREEIKSGLFNNIYSFEMMDLPELEHLFVCRFNSLRKFDIG